MPGISEQLLNDIASSVARRVVAPASTALPASYVLLALSGEGPELDAALTRLASSRDTVVAVGDCSTGSAGPIAATLARLPAAVAVSGEAAYDTGSLVAGAESVLAPAMDLGLASRVAAMQADTPASRVILRSLLTGVPVRASLDEREFSISPRAATGAREALTQVLERLRSLGVEVGNRGLREHPSHERFSFPEPLDKFVEFLETRPCLIETGKPCVDCGVCEARGF